MQGEATSDPVRDAMRAMGARARAAARVLAVAPSVTKRAALEGAAAAIRAARGAILAANDEDVAQARAGGQSEATLDRLALDPRRLEAVAAGVEAIAAMPDPVGRVLEAWSRPNGLRIRRVATPIGVVAVIFESRPNVTADAAALCLASGNASILRAGSEAHRSAGAIHAAMAGAVAAAGLPSDASQLVATTDRAAVGALLADMADLVDVIVPRGGRSLVARVQAEARAPVLAHLEGVNHVYLDGGADLAKARAITLDAKMRRVSVCGAAECLLVDRAAAARLLPPVAADLAAAGCALRGEEAARALAPEIGALEDGDFGREFLAAVMAVRVVEGVEGAIAHIARYGSSHTEAIVTEDDAAAARFLAEVDAAIVMRNASTQFADGGEFGFGGEIGIATGRLHARGPVGAAQLTTFKYLVEAEAAIRG